MASRSRRFGDSDGFHFSRKTAAGPWHLAAMLAVCLRRDGMPWPQKKSYSLLAVNNQIGPHIASHVVQKSLDVTVTPTSITIHH